MGGTMAKKKAAKEKEPCVCGHVELEHDMEDSKLCKFADKGPDDCKCEGFEEEAA